MIVLDASALLELLLNTEAGQSVASRLRPPEVTLHAPHLLDLEIAQILRRFLHQEALAASRAEQALVDLADLELARYHHAPFLPRIWALRDNLTAYDAAYVALAEALDAPLLTRDARLAGAPHDARIEVV